MATEWFSKTWMPTAHVSAPFLYAMGNQPMKDLLKDFHFGSDISIALLGSGDMRHIVKTVAELKAKKERPNHLHIFINDVDNCVIARNVLLLKMILHLDLQQENDFAFLWNVWYNMEISMAQHQKLVELLDKLIRDCELKEMNGIWQTIGTTANIIKQVYNDWKTRLDDKTIVHEKRRKYISERFNTCYSHPSSGMKASNSNDGDGENEMHRALLMHKLLYLVFNHNKERYKSKLKKELTSWYSSGSVHMPIHKRVNFNNSCINPTMMRPGSVLWSLHYAMNPFESFMLTERYYISQLLNYLINKNICCIDFIPKCLQ